MNIDSILCMLVSMCEARKCVVAGVAGMQNDVETDTLTHHITLYYSNCACPFHIALTSHGWSDYRLTPMTPRRCCALSYYHSRSVIAKVA